MNLTEKKKSIGFIKIIHAHGGIYERYVLISFYVKIYLVLLNLRIRKFLVEALSNDQSRYLVFHRFSVSTDV